MGDIVCTEPLCRHGRKFADMNFTALTAALTLRRVRVLQYKFIVDGEWKYAPDQTAMFDEQGNVNNVLEVQEYVPENLESLSSFDPPASPVSRCSRLETWPQERT